MSNINDPFDDPVRRMMGEQNPSNSSAKNNSSENNIPDSSDAPNTIDTSTPAPPEAPKNKENEPSADKTSVDEPLVADEPSVIDKSSILSAFSKKSDDVADYIEPKKNPALENDPVVGDSDNHSTSTSQESTEKTEEKSKYFDKKSLLRAFSKKDADSSATDESDENVDEADDADQEADGDIITNNHEVNSPNKEALLKAFGKKSTDESIVDGDENLATKGGDDNSKNSDKDDSRPILQISEKLLEEGLISQDQLDIALKVQRESPGNTMVGAILVEMGFITESALGEVLAESSGVTAFDPKTSVLDSDLIKQVPQEICTRFKAVPVLLEDDNVYIAMSDIYNVLAIDRIQRYFPKNYKMVPVHCNEADLSEIVDNYYHYDLSIDGILKEIENSEADELAKIVEQSDYTNPTVRLIDALLVDALRQGSSDLHFEPENNFLRLRYRIDGKMRHIRSFHKDYWSAIVVRIKILSGMNIAETRKPQDGRITTNVLGRQVDFRVAAQPTIHGENIVLRILDKKKALLPMEKLGYSEHNINALHVALKRPEGIIIVTGPTGSGKTTTLYSILNFINKPDVNIMTIEDPVEYQLPMIRQTNIREGAGMDFAAGIKSILRQDPDIIFVGEVRDGETAEMAMRAAMTGHQVFTTLHTNDALGAIPRLVDVGIKPKMLAGAVVCSIAQRLARKLCEKCKKEHEPTDEECDIMGLDKKNKPTLYVANGCEECENNGYKGRLALSEIVLIDPELDEMIAKEASRREMLKHLEKTGFVSMAQDGIKRIIAGQIDLDEVIRTVDLTEKLKK